MSCLHLYLTLTCVKFNINALAKENDQICTNLLSDRLLFVINTIKEEIVARVEDSSPRPTNMTDTLEHLIQETLGENRTDVCSYLKKFHYSNTR